MFVDDDPINNSLCTYVIMKSFPGTDIEQFTEPVKGLEFIEKDYTGRDAPVPTVLLLDINMPEINGWEFLDLFKKMSNDILSQFTIFILSSSVDQRDKDKAASEPLVSGFISKPLSIDAIKQIFNEPKAKKADTVFIKSPLDRLN